MNTSIPDAMDIRIHGYLVVFGFALFYYDHVITIDREIKCVWTQPKKPSTYLFLVNRYFLFLANIVQAFFEFTTSDPTAQRCESYDLSRQVLVAVNQLFVSLLTTLRVYALYGCSARLLGIMVMIAAILFILACGSLFAQGNVIAQPTFGCHIGLSHDASMRWAAAWEALFAYDSMVFILTFIKTWQAGRHMKFSTRGLTLITLLLRDGAIYFAVMALSNLANILTFYLCGPFLRGGLSTFSTSISVTMMSRLILNLHETANIGLFSTHNTTSARVSRLEFLNESLGGSESSRIQENVGRSGTPADVGECKNVLPDF